MKTTGKRLRRLWMRGFTLIETMIVVTIVGVVAAFAVPSFIPVLWGQELDTASYSVGAFIAQARVRAMTVKRCVRVRIDDSQSSSVKWGHALIMEELNSFDCEEFESASRPFIVDNATVGADDDGWYQIDRWVTETSRVGVGIAQIGHDMRNLNGGDGLWEIRFRPTGRLFSHDLRTFDDDMALVVYHLGLAGVDTPNSINASHGAVLKYVIVDFELMVCVDAARSAISGSGWGEVFGSPGENLSCAE